MTDIIIYVLVLYLVVVLFLLPIIYEVNKENLLNFYYVQLNKYSSGTKSGGIGMVIDSEGMLQTSTSIDDCRLKEEHYNQCIQSITRKTIVLTFIEMVVTCIIVASITYQVIT